MSSSLVVDGFNRIGPLVTPWSFNHAAADWQTDGAELGVSTPLSIAHRAIHAGPDPATLIGAGPSAASPWHVGYEVRIRMPDTLPAAGHRLEVALIGRAKTDLNDGTGVEIAYVIRADGVHRLQTYERQPSGTRIIGNDINAPQVLAAGETALMTMDLFDDGSTYGVGALRFFRAGFSFAGIWSVAYNVFAELDASPLHGGLGVLQENPPNTPVRFDNFKIIDLAAVAAPAYPTPTPSPVDWGSLTSTVLPTEEDDVAGELPVTPSFPDEPEEGYRTAAFEADTGHRLTHAMAEEPRQVVPLTFEHITNTDRDTLNAFVLDCRANNRAFTLTHPQTGQVRTFHAATNPQFRFVGRDDAGDLVWAASFEALELSHA